jgi:hypothetical protein
MLVLGKSETLVLAISASKQVILGFDLVTDELR